MILKNIYFKQGNLEERFYPTQISLRDFASLPVYRKKNSWIVFGTDRMSNLSEVERVYPNIYEDFIKGIMLYLYL